MSSTNAPYIAESRDSCTTLFRSSISLKITRQLITLHILNMAFHFQIQEQLRSFNTSNKCLQHFVKVKVRRKIIKRFSTHEIFRNSFRDIPFDKAFTDLSC